VDVYGLRLVATVWLVVSDQCELVSTYPSRYYAQLYMTADSQAGPIYQRLLAAFEWREYTDHVTFSDQCLVTLEADKHLAIKSN
jgi:hypothetical protein